MNTVARITIFGASSGLIWSLVPGFLSELFKSRSEVIAVLVAGVLTGIVVSFVLSRPLRRFSRRGSLWLGALALPLGGFCFGVIISFVHLAARLFTRPDVIHAFAPLTQGISFAVLSVISIFAVVLFPLAIFTTFLLRWFIMGGPRHEHAA